MDNNFNNQNQYNQQGYPQQGYPQGGYPQGQYQQEQVPQMSLNTPPQFNSSSQPPQKNGNGLKIAVIIISILLVAAIIAIVAILLNKDNDDDSKKDDDKKTEESVDEEEETTEEVTTEAETTEAPTTEAETTEATTEDVSGTVTTPTEGFSSIYADLDNRSFAINGKVYTLGVTTLQDMIDDGVPFDEDDIANAYNNINPDYQSSGFKIVLGEWYSAQVYVGNYTSENKTMAECPIVEIYLPVDLEEDNSILTFAFPLTITEAELIANSGEPTDRSDYTSDDGTFVKNTLEYKVDSQIYIGDSGYTFEFINGQLGYLYIDLK